MAQEHIDYRRAEEKLGPERVRAVLDSLHGRGDRLMLYFLLAHFALALVLAAYYQTWLVTVGVGLSGLLMFVASWALAPRTFLTRVVAGIALQTFVALHIYQMHGLAEMHFFFFTAFTMMIVYLDGRCMWPGALLIIGQHILFAVLHNSGVRLYFFEQSYVGVLKLGFHFGIALVHVGICGYWAVLLRRQTLWTEYQNLQLAEAGAILKRNAVELEHERQRAEDATRAKSDFLATMSHEIRTPMNGVLGMTDLLLETRLSGPQQEYAKTIHLSGRALLTIINDILDLSKIEAGKVTLDPAPFDLVETVQGVALLLDPRAREKKLKLEVVIEPEVPRDLLGDVGRIRQILLNLAGNSLKFTHQGGVRIEVRRQADKGLGDMLYFAVVDTGLGVSDDMRERMFQKFSQADGSSTRRYGGTGLGLAISKRLAELMGGDIGFTSERGRGSTFWFTAPLRIAPAPVRPSRALEAPRPNRGRQHVLVVEDNAVNQRVATLMLERIGCSFDVAGNGVEAVRRWEQLRYDLVLMDCLMPEMDGFEATREIRRRENGHHRTPIVALTANAMRGDRERCLDAGMDDHLPKPLSLEQLAAVLERWRPEEAKV